MNVLVLPCYVSSQDEVLSPKFDDESDKNSKHYVSSIGGVCDHGLDVNTHDNLSDVESIAKGIFNADLNSLHVDNVAMSLMFHVTKRRMIEVAFQILSFQFLLMSLVMISLKYLKFIPMTFSKETMIEINNFCVSTSMISFQTW